MPGEEGKVTRETDIPREEGRCTKVGPHILVQEEPETSLFLFWGWEGGVWIFFFRFVFFFLQ